jgi:hypothetical protein
MTSPTVPILLGGLFAWSIYRRVRRNIGKQKLRPRRYIFSLAIFVIFSLLFIAGAFQEHNMNLLFDFGGGLLLGGILGFFGLRLTKFETTNEGHFYTPNMHIGLALSLLLAGRIIYRFWALNNAGNLSTTSPTTHPPMQSPLTLFIIGLTFGYYIVYYIGLFVHTHDKKPGA